MLKDGLELQFDANVDGDRWLGKAWIPLEYLPPDVKYANAYAIHGSGDDRQYQAAYPADQKQCREPDL